MKKVEFLENCAGREKGTVEVVNDGSAHNWATKGAVKILEGTKLTKKEEKKRDISKPKATRAFAGAPLRK